MTAVQMMPCYERVLSTNSQPLAAGTRTKLVVPDTSVQSEFLDGRRWDTATSRVLAKSNDELILARFDFTFSGGSFFAAVLGQLLTGTATVTLELDIGGAFGTIAGTSWDLTGTAAAKRRSWTVLLYTGGTFVANGCTPYLTASAGLNVVNPNVILTRVR